MFYKPLLIPLLVQVFLTFAVWAYMYIGRFSEMSRKKTDPQDLATRAQVPQKLPDSAASADNLKNLFELPILFYTAILLALTLMIQDALLVQLAWVFVVLRIIHSLIHCSYNRVIHRFVSYLGSCIVLFLIWARLAQYILSN